MHCMKNETSMATKFLPCVVPSSMHTLLELFQVCHFQFPVSCLPKCFRNCKCQIWMRFIQVHSSLIQLWGRFPQIPSLKFYAFLFDFAWKLSKRLLNVIYLQLFSVCFLQHGFSQLFVPCLKVRKFSYKVCILLWYCLTTLLPTRICTYLWASNLN